MFLRGTSHSDSFCLVCFCLVKMRLVFSYNPADYYSKNAELRQCIDMIQSGYFTPEEPNTFHDISNTLLYSDRCVCAYGV